MNKDERTKLKIRCLKEMEKLSELYSDGCISFKEMNRQYKSLRETVAEIIAAEEIEEENQNKLF